MPGMGAVRKRGWRADHLICAAAALPPNAGFQRLVRRFGGAVALCSMPAHAGVWATQDHRTCARSRHVLALSRRAAGARSSRRPARRFAPSAAAMSHPKFMMIGGVCARDQIPSDRRQKWSPNDVKAGVAAGAIRTNSASGLGSRRRTLHILQPCRYRER
jgi:hypothetical protein